MEEPTADRLSTLLAELQEAGPLKRAYPSLRERLPGMLQNEADPHTLVLAAVARFASSKVPACAVWPGAAANAYCTLLLDAAEKLVEQPSLDHRHAASELAGREPRFFRKLAAVYGGGDGFASDAALVAARALLQADQASEAALLAADFRLLPHFDFQPLLRAVLAENKPHAVHVRLGTP